jgi:hypothetical protein
VPDRESAGPEPLLPSATVFPDLSLSVNLLFFPLRNIRGIAYQFSTTEETTAALMYVEFISATAVSNTVMSLLN